MDLNEIKNLAVAWFEGTSTPEQETQLRDFLKQGRENYDIFKSWEEDWRKNRVPSLSDEIFRNRLKEKLKAVRRRRILRYLTAGVAAAVLVGAIVGLAMMPSGETKTEKVLVETPYKMKTRLMLADGTVVWLNSASSLEYDTDFNSEDRRVRLTGEALFDVAKNSEKPFLVQLKTGTVKVTGTKFNVTCYENLKEIEVALLEGTVDFIEDDGGLTSLTAGELLCYNPETQTVSKSVTNVAQYAGWTGGRIDFESITLEKFFARLSAQYGVGISYQLDKLSNTQFRILLNNSESVEDILYALSVIVPVTCTEIADGCWHVAEKH